MITQQHNPQWSPAVSALTAVCVFVLGLVATPQTAAAFEAGPPWPDDQLPITYTINDAGSDDLTMQELEALFARSFETWTEVPCTDLVVTYEGQTSTGIVTDEEHTMAFLEQDWVLGDMVLGATLINLLSVDPRVVTVDIAFNGDSITWQIGGGGADLTTIDPESVFTHEVGHMLGLGHTRDDGSATMAAGYLPDLGQRTLSHDDKAGICHLYPHDTITGECDVANDMCPDDSTCGDVDGWSVCIEPRDGLEAPCSHSNINCQDLCVYTSFDLESGFCTRQCVTNEDCPENGECRAFGGTSVCFRGTPVLDGNPMDMSDTSGGDTGPDFEVGIVDGGSDTDTSMPDMVETNMDGESGDDGCGCASTRTPTPGAGASGVLLMLIAFLFWRRRGDSIYG